MAKAEFEAEIAVCMGGKVAEEMVYGPDHVTSGASSDIEKATKVALDMVTRFGMSELLGNVYLAGDQDRLSVQTREMVDREVRRIVDEGKERAREIMTKHRKELDLLATALVEYETLSKEEMEKVVKGESLGDKMRAAIGAPLKLPEVVTPVPASGSLAKPRDSSDGGTAGGAGVGLPGTEGV
jgi:ATP-dependent metalloprotease